NDLGSDGDTSGARAPVLTRIAEIGNGGGDPTGRGATQCVDHDHDFHQVVIGRHAGGLQDKNILAAHIVHQFHHDFTVAETVYGRTAEADAEVADNFCGKPGIGVASKYHHVAIGH